LKTKQVLFACAVVGLLFVPTPKSFANPALTFQGMLTGGQFYCGGMPVDTPVISGVWTVSIDPQTPAQVTLNVFYDGSHHLAFGYNALMAASPCDAGKYCFSGFGDSATATIDTNTSPATFAWHVELGGGCPPNHPYDSLTFYGVTIR
jgi:hypothetical protein